MNATTTTTEQDEWLAFVEADTREMVRKTANKYIKSIRNIRKADYAAAYLLWIMRGRAGYEPQAHPLLSTMAAQAVRLNIIDICKYI